MSQTGPVPVSTGAVDISMTPFRSELLPMVQYVDEAEYNTQPVALSVPQLPARTVPVPTATPHARPRVRSAPVPAGHHVALQGQRWTRWPAEYIIDARGVRVQTEYAMSIMDPGMNRWPYSVMDRMAIRLGVALIVLTGLVSAWGISSLMTWVAP